MNIINAIVIGGCVPILISSTIRVSMKDDSQTVNMILSGVAVAINIVVGLS